MRGVHIVSSDRLRIVKVLDTMLSTVVYSMTVINLVLMPAFLLGPYLLPLSVEVALKDYGIHLSNLPPGPAFVYGSGLVLMSMIAAAVYSMRHEVIDECLGPMGKLRTYICVGVMGVAIPIMMLGAFLKITLGLILGDIT